MTFSWLKAPKHSVRSISSLILLLILSTLHVSLQAQESIDQAKWDAGKALFKSQCQSCHLPDKKMTGPALQNVSLRWEADGDHQGKSGKEWLYEWVRNNNAVLESGHPYANALYQEYGKSVMSLFPQLSNDDIDGILYYADNFDKGAKPAGVVVASGDVPVTSTFPIKTFLWILIIGLGIVALILFRVFNSLERLSAASEGKPLPAVVPFWKNKKLVTLVVLAGVVFLAYTTASNAISLGRQQTYAPTQPIEYNHQVHAGKYQIDCQYCHSGASESKHSNIPSLSVCMNCHKNVQAGQINGRKEIAKIYSAIAYNPNSGTYFPEDASEDDIKAELTAYLMQDYESTGVDQDELDATLAAAYDMFDKPVEWVRIHNLPDHVYFNHAQHVNAGKVECQTCHGNIQEMDVVAQHSPLSMGWCINCHRQTEVDLGNNYYQVYEKFHEDLKSGKMDKVTVEDIGGTECQKCHY